MSGSWQATPVSFPRPSIAFDASLKRQVSWCLPRIVRPFAGASAIAESGWKPDRYAPSERSTIFSTRIPPTPVGDSRSREERAGLDVLPKQQDVVIPHGALAAGPKQGADQLLQQAHAVIEPVGCRRAGIIPKWIP